MSAHEIGRILPSAAHALQNLFMACYNSELRPRWTKVHMGKDAFLRFCLCCKYSRIDRDQTYFWMSEQLRVAQSVIDCFALPKSVFVLVRSRSNNPFGSPSTQPVKWYLTSFGGIKHPFVSRFSHRYSCADQPQTWISPRCPMETERAARPRKWQMINDGLLLLPLSLSNILMETKTK